MGNKILIVLLKNRPSTWDQELSDKPSANPYQTSVFAQIGKELGEKPIYLRAVREGHTVAQLLAFKRLQRPLRSKIPSALVPYMNALVGDITWTYGPVAAHGEKGRKAYLALLQRMLASQPLHSFVSIYPCPLQDYAENFLATGFRSTEFVDYIVDLSKSEEELWQSLDRKSTRYEIKMSEKKGVTVYQTTSLSDFDDYYENYMRARAEKGVPSHPRHHLETSFKLFSRAGMGRLFLAQWGSKTVAGAILISFKRYCVFATPWSSRDNVKHHLGSNEAVLWSMIKWCKQSGFRFFDITAARAKPRDKDAAGIKAFKAKWGGLEIPYHRYDLFRGPAGYVRRIAHLRGASEESGGR